MNDKDWRTLLYSISQGNCILVLGPEIPVPDETPAVGPDGVPLPPQFASNGSVTLPEMLAYQLCTEIHVTNLDHSNLAQVSEFYARQHGRNDLEAELVSFYQQAPRSELYAALAKIPFGLIVSLAHDTGLVAALEEEGRSPVVETYDFRGDQKAFLGLGRDDVGTAERPLVYNLYGHIDVPRSLVVTETDVLDFLSAVISKNPELPSDLRSHLRDGTKNFLLLGFGLTRWYLRILLHILKVNKRDTRSFALEHMPSEDQALLQETILFMNRGLKINSYNSELATFVEELSARVAEKGLAPGTRLATGATPVTSPESSAPKVFVSYASEDEVQATKLCDQLRGAGFAPWFDGDALRGGDRWDDVIQQALDEVDYVVVVQSAALAAKTFSYVNQEIDLALKRQRFASRGIRYVIPVRIDESPLLDELKHLQTIDLAGGAGFKQLESAILRDQQRRRKRVA